MLKNPNTKRNHMANGNGRILTPQQMAQQAAAPQQIVQQLQVAAPINDIQIVCMVAAAVPGTAAERVLLAQGIVAEAFANHERLQAQIIAIRDQKERDAKQAGGEQKPQE